MSSNVPIHQQPGRDPRGQRNLLTDMLGWDPFRNLIPGFGNLLWPGIDLTRTDDGYNLEFPVAGFRPDQIEITFQDDTLIVSGRSERRNFTRSLTLPDEIDPDRIEAHVDHGLLCLHLARRPEAQPRKISVQAGSSQTLHATPGTSAASAPPSGTVRTTSEADASEESPSRAIS